MTKITLSNLSLTPNRVVLNYVGQSGQILESDTYSIAASGTLRLTTPPALQFSRPKVRKWAILGAQSPLLVNVFFEVQAPPGTVINTIGFADSPPASTFSLPVEFEPGTAGAIGRTIALALANPSSGTNQVTLTLIDNNGNTVATVPAVALAPFAQTAIDLSASFQSVLPTTNMVGMVIVSGTAPVSAIALGDDLGPFFAIPTVVGRPH